MKTSDFDSEYNAVIEIARLIGLKPNIFTPMKSKQLVPRRACQTARQGRRMRLSDWKIIEKNQKAESIRKKLHSSQDFRQPSKEDDVQNKEQYDQNKEYFERISKKKNAQRSLKYAKNQNKLKLIEFQKINRSKILKEVSKSINDKQQVQLLSNTFDFSKMFSNAHRNIPILMRKTPKKRNISQIAAPNSQTSNKSKYQSKIKFRMNKTINNFQFSY